MRRVSDGLLANHVGGKTWWGRKWLELLGEHVDLRGPRGTRGRTLAKDGNVGELDIEAGRITARVSVGPTRSFPTSIELPVLGDAEWDRLLDVFAARLRWTAAFAANRIPEDVHLAEEEAGVQLFPSADEMTWHDEADPETPGRHVIALHHAVAAAMESNPLLLATMRGLRADQLLAGLRVRRAGRSSGADLTDVSRPDQARQDFFAAGNLDAITVHPHQPADVSGPFERLGMPPRIEAIGPLRKLVNQSADLGWKIAAGDGASAADDELLLAELRALRMAGPGRMAEALGWDPERTADALDKLFDDGRVLRTGTGDRVRYRAV